jgi:ElaB/YqjD/DUF883 family membrane-anchored ribosome-binding protein
VSDDPHTPTTAGPVPTPVVAPSDATHEHPAGTAAGDSGATSASSGDGVAAKASQATDQAKQKATQATDQAKQKATQVTGQAQEKFTQISGQAQQVTSERPEILVGAAFAGGFLSAMILKRLGR